MSLFGIFKKKEDPIEVETLKSDLIVMEELRSDEDRYIVRIASYILEGKPVIANFDALDIDAANKVISFLSGVIFAIDGELLKIKEKVYMFASKEVYEDGSMRRFLDDVM